jgi:sterol desaturase/sphingolipid hydroxylase (fatty acid hydroxylase superfamily)
VTEADFQTVRAAGFVVAAGLALALERLVPHARLRGDLRVNAGLWAVNLVVMGTVCGACACTVARWAAGSGIGLLNATAAPPWIAIPVSVVALDLVSYGWHRANHTLRLLWRFHRVHHSDRSFTASTGVRFHPGELLLSLPLRLAAVALVGAPAVGVVVFEIVFGVANLIEHGDIDLPGPLERRLARVLVTPALHRRHHGLGAAEHGSNFGTVFTLWDRLFGTYGDNASETRVATGLPDVPGRVSLGRALALPLGSRRIG